MRKLQGKDLLTVAKIVNAANISNIIEDTVKEIKPETSAEQVGIKMIVTIIGACGNDKVGGLIFKWLDDVLEVENSSTMDLFDLVEMITRLFEYNDFKRFFSMLRQSM